MKTDRVASACAGNPELGQVADHRVRDSQATVLGEPKDGERGERLRHGGNPVDRSRGGGELRLPVPVAVSVGEPGPARRIRPKETPGVFARAMIRSIVRSSPSTSVIPSDLFARTTSRPISIRTPEDHAMAGAQSMEVAFFTDSYPPVRDGVAAVTGGLARTLSRLGHTVRVYAPNFKPGPPSEEIRNGVTIRRVRTVPVPLYGQYRWPIWPFGLLRSDRGVKDADVIHLHTPGLLGTMAFLASRRFPPALGRNVPHEHPGDAGERPGEVPRADVLPGRRVVQPRHVLEVADVATAPSEAARDSLLYGAKKPFHHPVEVIPNGIDVERFRPDTPVPDWRARCGLPSAPLVTYLGRLTVDKGVHRFLDAVETAIPHTDLVAIVGGLGPEEGRVRERLAADPQLAARVRYVGPVAETEKAALLSQSDLFVLPSTSDTSSVALLEAMACGTPVIAPFSGGASEIVEDGVTGWRVAVTDPGALVTSLQRILDETEIRRKVGAQAADFVRQTASLETMARRFISLYRLVEVERPLRDVGIPR